MQVRGPVPPELMATWLRFVGAVDGETLEAFALRTWRMFDQSSLRPLEAAIQARRRDLAGGP